MAIMYQTLSETLEKHTGQRRSPRALVESGFAQTTSLADVVTDPGKVLSSLTRISGVGEVSIAHLKQAVFSELARIVPAEWAASAPCHGTADGATGLDVALVEKLRKFRTVWGISTRNVAITAQFHLDYTDPSNGVMAAALSATSPFVYAPEGIPEIVKTPAVLQAQNDGAAENISYMSRINSVFTEGFEVPDGSLLLIDLHRLDERKCRRGPFYLLQEEDVDEQLLIISYAKEIFPGLRTVVSDFRRHRLASGFATQDGPLFHYCFGGYLQINHPWMVQHFHETALSAAHTGISFADWLSRYR